MRVVLCLLSSVLVSAAPPTALAGQNGNGAASGRSVTLQSSWIPVHRSAAASLGRSVHVDLTRAPVRDALQQIADRAGLELAYSHDVQSARHRVSVRAEHTTVADALTRVLEGTGFEAYVTREGDALLVRRADPPGPVEEPRAVIGTISGRVTDAASGAGVSGASVLLEGTQFGAVTGNTGRYRIADVPAGTYEVIVQQIGFAEARQFATIEDRQEAVVDFALEVSALPMDEIVATGTAFETQIRAVPNPVSVITAKEIQAKGATKLEDLLRGEIPGVTALSGGIFDYSSKIYVRGNAGGSVQDLIKIYVDGVGLANAEYLSTLDPKSIERIEVVRGPQSSAIYGSGAASGVLQIFTKMGAPGLSRPQLEFQASAGMIESAYIPSDAGTPVMHDHSLQVSGGGESFSYRAGTSYATVGEWVKNYGSKRLSFSGGLRAVHGPFTAELTALWSDRDYDYGNIPLFLRFPAGACTQCGNPDYADNYDYALSQNTMALTLAWQATPKWRHTLTLGDDQNRFANHEPRPGYNTPADTFVSLNNREYRRRQVRYHTAYGAELGEGVTARWTVGLDYWSYDVQGGRGTYLLEAFGTVRASERSSYLLYNDGWWNAGYFGMAELGFGERFYVTLAGRVEDNPNMGEEYGRAFVPRVGASYVQALGSAEVKLRAQWGKGVRPPRPEMRTGSRASSIAFDLPNPEIAPEEKVGWDAGVDVYWGGRASLSLTRYSEEAKNLIYRATIDAASTPRVYQYRNIGVVGIEGWEVEGELMLGWLTLSANYACSDNVVKKVDAATAENPNATLLPGDRTVFAPKHSGGGRVTARVAGANVSVDASVMTGWRALDVAAYYGWIFGVDPYRGSIRDYYVEYPALWKWNLRAERALTERWSAFLRVENLTDNQEADLWNQSVTPGRTTVLGIRWTL